MGVNKAVILAGGLGTRMRHLTQDKIPKALVELNGKTLTEHSIDNLKDMGITDIILSIGHHSDKIKEYFGDGSRFGVNISYIVEDEPLGTGGWINLIDKSFLQETFMVLNGDDILRLGKNGLSDLVKLHQENNSIISIALTETENVSEKGVADLDGSRIRRFVEKPTPEQAPSNLISTGNYIFEPQAVESLPDKKNISLERDLFPLLASQGKLCGFKTDAEWKSIGTKEEYDAAKRG